MRFKFLILACFGLINVQLIHAQTVPVGMLEQLDDYYRRQQVLGNDTSNRSFLIRPLNLPRGTSDPDFVDKHLRSLIYQSTNQQLALYALPVVWQNQLNSHHPYGINDGAIIGAKGLQTMLSAGVYARFGPVSFQFKPEVVWAQNKSFTKISDQQYDVLFKNAYANYRNKIDLPEQFGTGNYHKFNLGQSSLLLNLGPISLGVSNENLWWGPGFRNALLMTNNAAGFKHTTFHTNRPIVTPIGSFETQVIGGKLEQSGIPMPAGSQYKTKVKDWRYLSAMVFTYQPKWLPGLYLGFDRSFVVNTRDMGNKFGDYFPIFSKLEKSKYQDGGVNGEDDKKRDQYISLFAKWVMPEAKSEVYLQWGRNDHSWDLRDAIVELEHTRAYVAGFRKLVSYKGREDEFIQIALELTQLESPPTKFVRLSEPWYGHYQVTDGYTNEGQVIGAGIGSGSNLQTLEVSWVSGLKRLGIQFERMVNQNDLYYNAYVNTIEPRKHWVDLDVTLRADWTFGQFLLSSQLGLTHSLNYQYRFENPTEFWVWDKQNANNVHAKIGVAYNFKL
ncbi:capsule assembly Wzi family protein [Pedobacter frigiditerrae]|uniref:capsule assembly Wzi family protein n=1 Tax=Pedobacter frigiditerrae TaxID=2530452 RepID=UPI0029300A72|nr:capsule assembly Wzi family protein [Pedobacter frigiditerrae]